MAAVVDLREVTVGYGEAPPVLANFSVMLPENSLTCVVGPSGVGKSTLLRVLAGLVAPRKGAVLPTPAGGLAREGCRPFALVFQEPRLLPWRRVIGNVMFGLEGLLDYGDRLRQAQSALALVGLADAAGRWPHQLTGGERQRVNLARALAVQPRLLLLDEPFSALDAVTRERLQVEVLRLWRQTGASFLFVTHDLEEAVFLAERVVVLGGRPARVLRDFPVRMPYPRHREAESFSGQVHRLREALSDLVTDGDGI
jgi:NitT/TauT family transport system ATP-binding protein